MAQALEIISVPAKRPPGVTPKQWRLAVLLPRAETAYEALIKAGYKPTTARNQTSRASGSVGVQLASEAIAASKRDKAREVKAESVARVLAEVKKDSVDPTFALSAWATAAKIDSEYPDQDQGLSDEDFAAANRYLISIVRFAVNALNVTVDDNTLAALVMQAQSLPPTT